MDHFRTSAPSIGQAQQPARTQDISSLTTSYDARGSRADDEIVLTGLKVQNRPRTRRRQTMDPTGPSRLHIMRASSHGESSSQEEYEESESESDQVMTSSNESPAHATRRDGQDTKRDLNRSPLGMSQPVMLSDDDDDENRTAVNHPLGRGPNFTPQPNAFSYPPSSGHFRAGSQPVPGSYFPASRPQTAVRRLSRHSSSGGQTDLRRQSHLPHNPLAPAYNAAAEHDEALRASLSSLLSVAAAARGLGKPDFKRGAPPPPAGTSSPPPRNSRVEPSSLRLVPESALPSAAQPVAVATEPTFQPTIRRPPSIVSTSTTSEQQHQLAEQHKRKAVAGAGRSTSRERRLAKKARQHATTADVPYYDLANISPTLLTWLVSAGVVICLSALSFGAGYSLGREAGLLEGAGQDSLLAAVDHEQLRACAQDAGRSSLGFRRSFARTAIQV